MPFYQLPSEQKQQIPGVKLQERQFFHSTKHKTIVRIFQRWRAGRLPTQEASSTGPRETQADKDNSYPLVIEATASTLVL